MTPLRLAAIATLLATVVTSEAIGATHHRRCTDGGARVRLANDVVQVVTRGGRTWGCWIRTGSRHLIAATSSADGPATLTARRLVLAGRYLAFNQEYSREDVEESVSVLDVRTGRSHGADAVADVAAPRPDARNAVTAIVLRPDGAVAWIARNDDIQPARYEVLALGAGRPALLATGPDIDPASLAVAGSRVYWTAAGAPQLGAFPSP
jgi:hypothetical protein